MAKTTKPTKQQIAQAKARAGGNNPVKVTNAGLKKLGNAALMVASFTPVGRVAKVAATAAKPIAAAARNAAGKKVVSATMGKAAAEKYATAAAKRTAQRTQTAADLKNAKTFASPSKASVQVKPARKQVGNPPNLARAEGRQIDSVARGEGVKGPLGKARDRRVFTSKNPTGSGNASKPVESKLQPKKTVPKAKLITPLASKMPARKPIPNPANPPRGTVRINSGSNRPAMLRKRAVRAIPKKK